MYQNTIIVGNLGADPVMRYTPGGDAVTSFSVAVSRKWKGKDGEPREKTTWFKVTAWRKMAEVCNQYLTKGQRVLVEGEVSASAWTGQDGEPRASLELTAREVKFLGGKNESGPGPGQDESNAQRGDVDRNDLPF